MLFNSFEFIFVFFPIVTLVYYLFSHSLQIIWLLCASCFFYMFFVPEYIFVLLTAILIDYSAAIFIEREKNRKKKKYWLLISVIATCLLLFVFKYSNFFIENFNAFFYFINQERRLDIWHIVLPIGLSFHTFQSLSYVVEVYRGKVAAERNFLVYSLYVLFYPQLVAGPIERPQNIIPQIHTKKRFEWSNIFFGLRLMTWGMFKKVVIADNLSKYSDMVFNDYTNYSGATNYLGAFFFTIQIYCDFSGYSDIARGAAKTLGYNLMENFNLPYMATSFKDFWSRWHISLSTWFRDYIYFPLGGNRISSKRTQLNQMIVFLISGFWHGANWTFVFWGGLHGSFVAAQNMLFKKKIKLPKWIVRLFIFNCVLICWIYFRATSFSQANFMITSIFTDFNNFNSLNTFFLLNGGSLRILSWVAIGLLFLLLDARVSAFIKNSYGKYQRRYSFVMAGLVACIVLIGYWGKINFIYFQF